MNVTFRTAVVVLATTATLAFATPAFAGAPKESAVLDNAMVLKQAASPQLQTGGSSFDANLVQAALTQYATYGSNNQSSFAAYASSKSGVGRAGAVSGALNIGFSDFPLNFAGQDTATPQDYVQVPVALGGVAIVYNVNFPKTATVTAGNKIGSVTTHCTTLLKTNPLILTGAELGLIFDGKITKWSDARLEATNPALNFSFKVDGQSSSENCLATATTPSIAVESRTSGSGTTFMFTDYLHKVAPTEFPAPTSAAFADAATESSNSAALAQALTSTDGSIGYVEYGYSISAQLPVARLVNQAGDVINLTYGHVQAAAIAGVAKIGSNFSLAYPQSGSTAGFSVTDAPGATSYPIAGFSYAITPALQPNAKTGVAVTKFLLFLTQSKSSTEQAQPFGQDLAQGNGYVGLPAAISAFDYKALATLHTKSIPSLVSASN
jgi:phosphate transport system substrate-binding protein